MSEVKPVEISERVFRRKVSVQIFRTGTNFLKVVFHEARY